MPRGPVFRAVRPGKPPPRFQIGRSPARRPPDLESLFSLEGNCSIYFARNSLSSMYGAMYSASSLPTSVHIRMPIGGLSPSVITRLR